MATQGFQDPQSLLSEQGGQTSDDDIFRNNDYRQLILSIAQELGIEDIEKLTYQQGLKTTEFKSPIQVLRYLEQRDRIGPHKVSNLSTILKGIHREDLVSKMIDPFQQKFPVPIRFREMKFSSQTSLPTCVSDKPLNDTEIRDNMPFEGAEQEFSTLNGPISSSQVEQETGNPEQGQLSLSQHSNVETLRHALRMPSFDKMYISNSNTNSSVNLSFEDTGSQYYIRSQETYGELNTSSVGYSSPDFPSSGCSDPLHLKRSSSSGFGDQKKATNSISSSSSVSECFSYDKKRQVHVRLFPNRSGGTGLRKMTSSALPSHEESFCSYPRADEHLKTSDGLLCLSGVSQTESKFVSPLEHQSTTGMLSNTGELVINEQPRTNPMESFENTFQSSCSGSRATVMMPTTTPMESAENAFQSSRSGSSATLITSTKSTLESTEKASQSICSGSSATVNPMESAEKGFEASCSGSSATVAMSKNFTTPKKVNDPVVQPDSEYKDTSSGTWAINEQYDCKESKKASVSMLHRLPSVKKLSRSKTFSSLKWVVNRFKLNKAIYKHKENNMFRCKKKLEIDVGNGTAFNPKLTLILHPCGLEKDVEAENVTLVIHVSASKKAPPLEESASVVLLISVAESDSEGELLNDTACEVNLNSRVVRKFGIISHEALRKSWSEMIDIEVKIAAL